MNLGSRAWGLGMLRVKDEGLTFGARGLGLGKRYGDRLLRFKVYGGGFRVLWLFSIFQGLGFKTIGLWSRISIMIYYSPDHLRDPKNGTPPI